MFVSSNMVPRTEDIDGPGPKRGKALKTLIVEDSRIFRVLLKDTLKSKFPRMKILEAPGVEEAEQKIREVLPDMVFLDIRLPRGSGLELAKRIKARYPNIIVIILTSYDTPEYREAASDYGADYFLVKGTSTRDSILDLIESIVAKGRDR